MLRVVKVIESVLKVDKFLVCGRRVCFLPCFVGAHGVRGWVAIFLSAFFVLLGRGHGKRRCRGMPMVGGMAGGVARHCGCVFFFLAFFAHFFA